MVSLELTYKGKIRSQYDARRFWRQHNTIQKKIEKKYVPLMFLAIKNQIMDFLGAVKKYGYEYAKSNLNGIVTPNEVIKVLKDLYLKGAYIEGNYVLNYINHNKKHRVKRASTGLGFEELAPLIDEYFRIHLIQKSALPITQTTRKMIINHLINEVDRGKPLDTAIHDFTGYAITEGGGKAKIRANNIIKTESTKVMSFGGLIGAYMSGADLEKVWVTSDDERVRGLPNYNAPYSHVDLDLSVSDLLKPFYNNENIDFPGDPKAHIKNTIRCRCALYYREKVKPKPVVTTRRLSDFITDFLIGFFLGEYFKQLIEDVQSEN